MTDAAAPAPETGERCHYCDCPATRLCDFILGMTALCTTFPEREPMEYRQEESWRVVDAAEGSEVYTCDRPLCDLHAMHAGQVFFDGDDWAERQDIDYCRDHWGRTSHDSRKFPAITADEATAMQRRLRLRVTPAVDGAAP